MSDEARVTQQYAEVAAQHENPRARVTQQSAEAALSWANPRIRVTQQYVEVSFRVVIMSVNTVEFQAIASVCAAPAANLWRVNSIRRP